MEVFCRMCGVSSGDESIVTMRAEFGDVLCQPCYEKRLDEWARSFRETREMIFQTFAKGCPVLYVAF
jgi:hypothetical protein